MNVNSVSISGYLSRDAEKRATTAGSTVPYSAPQPTEVYDEEIPF